MIDHAQLLDQIREGMTVFGADDRPIGTVEALDDRALTVNGRPIPVEAIDGVIKRHVYLAVPATTFAPGGPAAAGDSA